MTNIEDIIQISEFKRNTKTFLDSARTEPVLIRRGLEVFELRRKALVGIGDIEPKEQPTVEPPRLRHTPYEAESFRPVAPRTEVNPKSHGPNINNVPKPSQGVQYKETTDWGA